MSTLIFIIIIFVLVMFHELGHFLFAKAFKIQVDEFAFGFGPTLWKKQIGETLYCVNLFPFGGYVKMPGENGDEDGTVNQRSFANQIWWKKSLVLIAGVLFNILLAIILFSLSFSIGLLASTSKNDPNAKILVTAVRKDFPAEKSGIIPGDVVKEISVENDVLKPKSTEDVQSFIRAHKNKSINLSVERGGAIKDVVIEPIIENNLPLVGVSLDRVSLQRHSIAKSFFVGTKQTFGLFGQTIKAFIDIVSSPFRENKTQTEVSGPLGIISSVKDATRFGFGYLLSFSALISINLAVMNLIPFPALDGGRLVMVLSETVVRRKIPTKVLGIINGSGFLILILLMVFVTVRDILHLF